MVSDELRCHVQVQIRGLDTAGPTAVIDEVSSEVREKLQVLYSERSTSTGSTRVALSAGIQQASKATPESSSAPAR